jgi:hypothetical protein
VAKPPEPKISLQELMKWKTRCRMAESKLSEQALMQEAVQAVQPATALVPEKSPLETWAEANSEDPDAPAPARVILAERKWQQEHEQRQVAVSAAQAEYHAMVQSLASAKLTMTDDVMGEGLGFDSLTASVTGAGLLTEYDKRAIRAAGPEAGEMLYDVCKKRALAASSPMREEVRALLRAHRPPPPAPNPQPKPAQQRPAAPAAPTRREVLSGNPNYIADLDLEEMFPE